MKIKILSLSLLFLCSIVSAQKNMQTLYLNNGSILMGTIEEVIPDEQISFKMSDGSLLVIPASDVQRIVRNESEIKPATAGTVRRSKGYRSFFEDGVVYDFTHESGLLSFSTIQGFQVNPQFFFGVGASFEYDYVEEVPYMPFFADTRLFFLDKRTTPFLEIRGGYSVVDGTGTYVSAMLGCDVAVAGKFGLYAELGYQNVQADINWYDDVWYYGYHNRWEGLRFSAGVRF